MQRRAAAVYFVLFIALAGGAYGFMEVGASEPEVELDGPTYTQGDTLTVDGRTYTVGAIEAQSGEDGITRSGELTWSNESKMATGQLENDSTVQYRDTYRLEAGGDDYATFARVANESEETYLRTGEEFQYVDRNATAMVNEVTATGVNVTLRQTTMLANNSTVAYDGGDFRVQVPSEDSDTFTLVNTQDTTDTRDVSVGDEFYYQSENANTTVDGIESGNVTLRWTENATINTGATVTIQQPYQVPSAIGNESVTLTEVQNLSGIVANDPAATNITDGYVLLANGTYTSVDEYLPPNATATNTVGDDFYYMSESTSAEVTAIEATTVTLQWPAADKTESIGLSEGGNVTLNGQQYFAHFIDNQTVQILPSDEYYSNYQNDLTTIDAFHTRTNGLWGIVLLSMMGGIILLAAAYLPNKG